jgi:hypothetical protein
MQLLCEVVGVLSTSSTILINPIFGTPSPQILQAFSSLILSITVYVLSAIALCTPAKVSSFAKQKAINY